MRYNFFLKHSYIDILLRSQNKKIYMIRLQILSARTSVIVTQMTTRFLQIIILLLTLSLLMSNIYMELLVKPKILTSCIYKIYGLPFGKAESRLFLFAAQCFNTESMQKVSCGTVVCKHFSSSHDYPIYRWDLIR
jgi:hypothetical protein